MPQFASAVCSYTAKRRLGGASAKRKRTTQDNKSLQPQGGAEQCPHVQVKVKTRSSPWIQNTPITGECTRVTKGENEENVKQSEEHHFKKEKKRHKKSKI